MQVIHLLTTDSIEERVWETLRVKKSVFAGVFDSPATEISFAALGRKSVLQAVKEIFADQPTTKPTLDRAPSPALSPKTRAAAPAPGNANAHQDALGKAAAGLIEAGLKFLESLTAAIPGEPPQETPVSRAISGLFSRDPRTNRPVLSIPLPESITEGRLTRAITGLLNTLARPA